jgi:hypothetical protein
MDRRVVLSVDAVFFWPRVAITDNLSVEGLDDLNELQNQRSSSSFGFIQRSSPHF